jgi:hippurate hydrolase
MKGCCFPEWRETKPLLASFFMKLIDSILTEAAGIASLRRDIHAHPELCFEEVRTADLVAERLTAWGIPIHRGMGTTGVVGIVHGRDGGACGRGVGLRADMDALPMQEFNKFAHASREAGKMHACGHDGHTAMLLAAAQHFAKHRDFDGTVYLIFQPAEEGGGGAREMIKDGMFEKFPMEAVFGMHNWPGAAVGTFSVSPGPVMASSNEFKITVRGKGGHAALPHNGVDPVLIACQLVQAFQTIISRNKKPVDAGVISVTMIHAGEATNVIPDACELQGTVRTFTIEVLDLIEARMKAISEQLCEAFGARCEFEFSRNYPPPSTAPKKLNLPAASWPASWVRPTSCSKSRPWARKTFRTCSRPSRARTASSPTATARTGRWAMAAGPACCTTRAMTSTTI